MLRLATGVMWVEKEILGLSAEFLIVEPNAKRGNMLLDVMLEGGNFGRHSSVQKLNDSYYTFRFAKAIHLIKIASLFPGEVIFRLYQKTEMLVKHIIRR